MYVSCSQKDLVEDSRTYCNWKQPHPRCLLAWASDPNRKDLCRVHHQKQEQKMRPDRGIVRDSHMEKCPNTPGVLHLLHPEGTNPNCKLSQSSQLSCPCFMFVCTCTRTHTHTNAHAALCAKGAAQGKEEKRLTPQVSEPGTRHTEDA